MKKIEVLSHPVSNSRINHSREGFHGLVWVIIDVDWVSQCGQGFSYHERGSEWRSWVPSKNIVF